KILQALPLEQRAQARADMLASAHAIAQARRQMAAANEGEGEAEENEAAGDDGHQPGTVASADTNNGQASEATAPFHIYYYHPDQIGTPRELTNAEGQIVWRAEYLAWGNTLKLHWLTDAAPVEQPLRFQGQYYDEETGLHYNRFRYYDPDLGRFVSQDPIGLAGGENLYEYAFNPNQWIDPLGLSGSTIDGVGKNVPLNTYGIPDGQQFDPKQNITKAYRRNTACGPTTQQTNAVQGVPCVVCGQVASKMVADHKDALTVEYYRTGQNDVAHQSSVAAVQSHCPTCSRKQGGYASKFSRCMKRKLGI
ncbi:RHS repeat-associated core domain-containing protein, partial [Parachitinimonas caeni]